MNTVSNWVYFSLWLAAALVATAFLSATIARNLKLREVRRAKALELLENLVHYSDWVAGQRRAAFFQGESHDGPSPLEAARGIIAGWFPELSADMVNLLIVHNRLVDFLWNQQVFRMKDPESWLVSDHDTRFMELWRQQQYAVEAMAAELQPLTGRDASEPLENGIAV